MPIYEYQCAECSYRFEALQKMSDAVLKECPRCKSMALKKLVSVAAFRLKGSGWYETDFKNEDKRNLVEEKTDNEKDSNKLDKEKSVDPPNQSDKEDVKKTQDKKNEGSDDKKNNANKKSSKESENKETSPSKKKSSSDKSNTTELGKT